MKIIHNKLLPPKGYAAITIFPFIFTRKDSLPDTTMNHENIHGRQQVDMLIIFFYLWYGIEWVIRLIQYRNAHTAYRNISFEREAYANQYNVDYLTSRKCYGFIRYLKQ